MASRKNKWRRCGRLEFRRETKRYSDGTPWGHDVLYIRVRRVACAVVEPWDGPTTCFGIVPTVSVSAGTYRLTTAVKAARIARDYINYRLSMRGQNRIIEQLRAEGIVLFAQNTGKLYQEHLALARRKAPVTEWSAHVRHNVLPLYRRQVGPCATTSDARIEAAAALKDYYENYIRENAL